MFPSRILFAAVLLILAGQVDARDRIRIVGSASVLQFVQPVAEHFARHWGNPMPTLEITGAGAGFELFCAGVGFEHPDVVAAARAMTEAERAACAGRGVAVITEIELGRDAMVLVHAGSGPGIDLTRGQLFAALAAEVVAGEGLAANTAARWSDVDPSLPGTEILVMAPEPNTSAAIAFQELAMAQGCRAFPLILGLADQRRERVCRALRQDGRVVNAAKLQAQVADWLQANEHAYAVTNYIGFKGIAHQVKVNAIEGVMPSDVTIADNRYPLATSLYVYVKDRHVQSIPSLQQLVYELTSERAEGPEGYLAERGLVPLDDIGRNRARDAALKLGIK